MICRRRYSIFSKDPLTYEVLNSRCVNFANQKVHRSADLKDYITANTKLQQINCGLDPQLKSGKHSVDLGLRLNVSNNHLERDLTDFTRRYWPKFVARTDVVNAYILSAHDVSNSFDLVQENFQFQVKNKKSMDFSPVSIFMHVLMRQNDYLGCFKLVDRTLNSQSYLNFKRRRALNTIVRASVLSTSLAASTLAVASFFGIADVFAYQDWINNCFLLWPYIPLTVIPSTITVFGFGWVKTANFKRVSWRPHTSIWHRILHFEEALFINKIVANFEENHEVNVKNFHVSEMRQLSQTSVFDQTDYELHIPHAFDSLAHDFRSQLYQRKLVWDPLQEEGMFLDFWVSHGDSYEWVEPDQDPAEIVMLSEVKFK